MPNVSISTSINIAWRGSTSLNIWKPSELAATLSDAIKYSAKPTDSDFSSQIKKLQNAGCDLIAMGTQIRSTIIPYIKAKEINWSNVDFVATSASYFSVVAEQPNGIMDGLYCLNGIVVPYYENASDLEKEWWDRFRDIYDYEPNSGAIYGYIYADIFIEAIKRAGKDLNVESFVNAMESLNNYEDPLKLGSVTFNISQRPGSNISYFFFNIKQY